jgi:glycosyltransferase involved in cell wall biosynthesis
LRTKLIHATRIISFTLNHFLVIGFIALTRKKKYENAQGVLFLELFPTENAGYFYRSKKWTEILNENGTKSEVVTIIEDREEWNELFFHNSQKYLLISLWKRFRQIKYSRKFETIIVRKELLQYNDYGKLYMEKFLLKIHPNAILDFDDDLSSAKGQPREVTNSYGKFMGEDGDKFNNSLRLYKRFIVASNYLNDKIKRETQNDSNIDTLICPTCVDYNSSSPIKNYDRAKEIITFGWIGSDNNLHLLDSIIDDLNLLLNLQKFELLVISKTPFVNEKAKFNIKHSSWAMATQTNALLKIDIGLMPLTVNDENKGKAGFKLIQYMGLGIVSIATNLTINGEIIDDEQSSFLNPPNEPWLKTFETCLDNRNNFTEIGKKARMKILNHYTFDANKMKYIEFINKGTR